VTFVTGEPLRYDIKDYLGNFECVMKTQYFQKYSTIIKPQDEHKETYNFRQNTCMQVLCFTLKEKEIQKRRSMTPAPLGYGGSCDWPNSLQYGG
jgi:hypothetical protein